MNYSELKYNVDLEGFLIDHGYTIKKEKSSRRSRVYTNGSEHIIVTQKNRIKLYFCAENSVDRGSIIDFLYYRPEFLVSQETNMHTRIVNTLLGYLDRPCRTIPGNIDNYGNKVTFDPEQYTQCEQRFIDEFRYLRYRGISDKTLHSDVMENIGLSTNLHYTNIAFPLYNEEKKLVGLDLRNFNYRRFAAGTDKSHALWLSNFGIPEEVVIAESPIDLLSFHQLLRTNDDKILYISTGGVLLNGQIQHLLRLIQENNCITLTIAFDNDIHGKLYTNKLLVALTEGKVQTPVHVSCMEKRYCNLHDKQLREVLNNNVNIRVEYRELGYDLVFRNEEADIDRFNAALLVCINQPITKIQTPILKDFNEDLQLYNRTRQININVNNRHKGINQ